MKKIFHPKQIIIIIITLIIAVISPPLINVRATGWDYVGSPLFSEGEVNNISFAIDGNDMLYVAFEDYANLNNATVMRYTDSSWDVLGYSGFSGGVVSDTSLAFDNNNTLYVGFKDAVGKATVMKYTGSNWEVVGIRHFSAGTVSDISLAVGTDDLPYLAYRDEANAGAATVMKFNGTNWVLVGSAGFSAAAINTPSLAFDNNNTPYLAYQEGGTDIYRSKVTVMKFNGPDWALIGNRGFSPGRANDPSLVLGSDNTPYIGFVDTNAFGKATVMKFNGTDWVLVGSAGFSAAEAENTSLTLDSNDIPYIAYTDFTNNENKATVMKFKDSTNTWESVGVAGFTASEAYEGQIALNSSKVPYFAYLDTDGGASAAAPTVMKFGGTANTPEMRITKPTTQGASHILNGNNVQLNTVLKGRASQFTFMIENTGDADLNLTSIPEVSISGANADAFVVASQPASPVSPGTSTTFIIEFDPAAAAQHTATISIANNDSDETPYTFNLQITSVALPAEALLWTNSTDQTIYVAERLDGSNVAPLITGLNEPHDIAVDATNKKLYFTDTTAGTIYTSDLDGRNGQTVLTGLGEIYGIAVDPAGGKIYWTNGIGSVWSAYLNGSTPTEIRSGLGAPHDLAIDATNGKLYVTEPGSGVISRSNLNGSSAEDLLTGLYEVYGIAVDPTGAKIYWTDYNQLAIYSANLDGSNVSSIVTGLKKPHDIAIDTATGKLYFTDFQDASVYRSDLAGTNLETLHTANQEDNVYGIAVTDIIDKTPPGVSSIKRVDANPTNQATVHFIVTFDENVNFVDVDDFTLTNSGDITGASPSAVTGSGNTFTVTVQTGKGSGDLRLDIINNDTITDDSGNVLAYGYTGGETYTINRPVDHDAFGEALAIPSLPYNVTLDTSTTSSQPLDPDVNECNVTDGGDATIWYTYTPTENTAISIDTFGSNYDTFIAIWDYNLNLIACSNQNNANEQLVHRINKDTTYYIEIGQPLPGP